MLCKRHLELGFGKGKECAREEGDREKREGLTWNKSKGGLDRPSPSKFIDGD